MAAVNMIKALFNKYYLPIAVLLIVIAGTLGFTFILRPSIESFRVARLQVSDINDQYEAVYSRFETAQMLEEQLIAIAPREIEKLQSMFIDTPELAHLLGVIQKNAQATRFLLTALEVGGAKEEVTGPLKDLAVQAQLEGGGYRELKEFLRLVTVSVPLLEINSFTYSPNGAMLSLNLKVHMLETVSQELASIDAEFFSDSKFRALRDPVPLPVKDPVGRENPFAPVE